MMEKIVRGYILPRPGPVYVEEISADEGEKMLNDYLELIRQTAREFLQFKGKKVLETAEELNELLNELVVKIKCSLYLDPVPEVIPSLTSLLTRVLRASSKEALRESFEGAIREVRGVDLEVRKKLFNILRYPADSRPGANTSSLLLHLMVTSSLAVCTLLNSMRGEVNVKKLVVVRLASLFHDIGKFKMRKWRTHEKESAEILVKVFSEFTGGEALKIVKEASEGIGDWTVTRADANASNIDRLLKHLTKTIPLDLARQLEEKAKKYEGGLESAYNKWDFWENEVTFDLVKKISEEFCKNASKITPDNPLFAFPKEIDRGLSLSDDVVLVRFDVRGIQRYISVEDLRSMAGASMIVDVVCSAVIPWFLIKKLGLPAECILYFGGGNETVIVPKFLVEENKLDEVCRFILREFKIEVTYAVSELYGSLPIIEHLLSQEMARKKVVVSGRLDDVEFGIVRPNLSHMCDYCFSEPAVEQVGDDLICENCAVKRNFGDKLYFSERVRRLNETVGLGLNWEELREWVMEYIAGGGARKGEKLFAEYSNIALIRFDGNLMGQLIASSVSITDAVERSLRIDYATKKGLNDFLNYLKERSPHDYARVVLGTIYIGGDDGFILCPSYLAIPLAMHMLKEFHLQMGGRASLSVGLVSAKPKHPLIELYKSAGYLLSKYAKSQSVRDEAVALHAGSARSRLFAGGIAFFATDRGIMTVEALDSIIEDLSARRITMLPSGYAYSDLEAVKPCSVFRLLNLVFDGKPENFNFQALTNKIISSIDGLRSGRKDEFFNKLLEVRSIIMDVMAHGLFGDYSIKVKVIHAVRQEERFRKEEAGEIYRKLVSNLIIPIVLRGNEFLVPVHDALHIVKIIGGGLL